MAIYEIDKKILRENTRTIYDEEGNAKRLSESELNILLYMINNQGKVIDKEALLSIGWPNRIVVTNSLTVAIASIRRVLGFYDSIYVEKGVGYSLSDTITIKQAQKDEVSVTKNELEKEYSEYKSKALTKNTNRIFKITFIISSIIFLSSLTIYTYWTI